MKKGMIEENKKSRNRKRKEWKRSGMKLGKEIR